MAYKIKKSILSGTSGHRKALKLAKANLRLNRSVNKNMPDGRSKSSAFQLTDEEKTAMIEENIKWEDPVTESTSTTEGVVTTDVESFTQKGRTIPTGPKTHHGMRDACSDEYIAVHGTERCDKLKADREKSREGSETRCSCPNPAGGDRITWEAVDGKCIEDPRCKKKEEKKCECASKQEYHGVKVGQMLEYPCDGPKHPGCEKMPETTTPGPGVCYCTDKEGNDHTYPCTDKDGNKNEKPKVCFRGKEGTNPDCPPSRKESCPKGKSWNWEKCKCKKYAKVKKVRFKKPKKRKNCIGKFCEDAYGGITTSFSPK